MIRRTFRQPSARRGAILLVVLGMLALFAVVGLSFVLYAESEATGARNNRAARNELADPDPADAANQFLAQLIFDTNNPSSALYYQSLAKSRFGLPGNQSPYTGNPIPTGTNPAWVSGPAIDQSQVLNLGAAYTSSAGVFNPAAWNRAVPWTYPDRNNYYLAYYDPATDQITVPSFHRPDLFGSLDPTNPNWTVANPQGRFLTLRPRPAEHPSFPTVPMNADGTFTGDVANLKFLTGKQNNDSLWMDIGSPVKTWRGRQFKMLVAPLILDLGGRVNLSLAGNVRSGGAHGSTHGWGYWEVNPTGLLGGGAGDLLALANLRYTGANPVAPTPSSLDRFRNLSTGTLNRGLMPPLTSQIDADGWGGPGADPMTLPGAGGFYPFPTYTARYAGNQALLTAELTATHGQSFSPYQWLRQPTPIANNPWVPGLEDQLRLDLRSGGPKGNPGYAGQFNPNNRLTTLFSVSQRWGEIQVLTSPTTSARLAAIDITRPLPDYRTNLTGPLSPQNIANLVQARIARQNLARDIFVRLAATANLIDGTNVSYNPLTAYLNIGAATPLPAFNSLRVWAQYAANMVDQIDSDDVCTTFVWNPADPTQPDVNDTVTGGNANVNLPNFAIAQIANRTVYGTELPKLVLNEVYCMLNNSRRDSDLAPNTGPPPMGIPPKRPNRDNLQKKYWIELHNPLFSDASLPDAGAARLQYDSTAPSQVFDATAGALAPYTGPNYSPYQIEVAEVPTAAAGAIAQPYSIYLAANPLGGVADTTLVPGMATKLRLTDYTPWNSEQNPAVAPAPIAPVNDALTNVVQPANGANAGNGYFLIGPRDLFPSNPQVPNNLSVTDFDSPLQKATVPANPALKNALIYDTLTHKPMGNTAPINDPMTSTSVILLRRLVNPYMFPQPDPTLPNYNPYMTVDYLENVPTRDRAKFDDTNDRTVGGWMTSVGATVGRRHPYAAAPVYGTAANPGVADQSPVPPIMNNPPHTFLSANSNLDNLAGLAWLAHLDREPVNQLELLNTSVRSPTLLTQQFFDGALYQKHYGFAAAGTPAQPPLIDQVNYVSMARAFDLLQVGSRLPGIPLGGREPGRINMNAVGNPNVLNAVLDPQSGNLFNAAYVATVAPLLLTSRTTTPGVPSTTAFELNASNAPGTDRPFQPGGQLFLDSLFRQNTVTPNYPALFNSAAGAHLHLQAEPLRKGWNNLTTVSDGFLVVFTVGFFEVNGANQLGQEIFDKVPGDLRAQYASIVDRSAITMNIDPTTLAVQTPNVNVAPATPATLGPKPWETKLAGDSMAGANQIVIQANYVAGNPFCTVFDDGQQVNLQANSVLWVGYSMANPSTAGVATNLYPATTADGDGEAVRVTGVAAGPTAGTAILTVQTFGGGTLRRFHGGGSRVSNAPVGHPGPQPNFNYQDDRYRGVLPFFMRMVP